MVFMVKITGTYLSRLEQTKCIYMRGSTKTDIPLAMQPVRLGLPQLGLETISLHCSDSCKLLGANYWLQYTGMTDTFAAWVELAPGYALGCTSLSAPNPF